jgi:tRNA-2-methylthio-N6-dimethylallyladenosine synthase
MFTFIYSPREGTPAAKMPDPYTREEKQVHFDRLVETANEISAEIHHGYEGKDLRVLVDGQSGRAPYNLTSRTEGGRLVHLQGDPSLIGSFVNVHITSSNTWALFGEVRNETI